MHAVVKTLLKEIKAVDKPANRTDYQRFFKEKLEHPVGLRTPIVRGVSNKVFKTVRSCDRDEILDICDEMLASGRRYTRFVAFEWAQKLEEQYARKDIVRFERWLKKYVSDWASCDQFCGILGSLIATFPDLSPKREKWVASRNMWLRRASAVALIVPVTRGLLLKDVFKTAELLMRDDEDLVQKGYGWMLKVAGDYFFDDVHKFVMKHKKRMSRTALRYAIEKWPAAKRKQAMKLD
ncbi:MAG: DNA alkylation repair protein [Candidatus Eisenbacteria bacterium]